MSAVFDNPWTSHVSHISVFVLWLLFLFVKHIPHDFSTINKWKLYMLEKGLEPFNHRCTTTFCACSWGPLFIFLAPATEAARVCHCRYSTSGPAVSCSYLMPLMLLWKLILSHSICFFALWDTKGGTDKQNGKNILIDNVRLLLPRFSFTKC